MKYLPQLFFAGVIIWEIYLFFVSTSVTAPVIGVISFGVAIVIAIIYDALNAKHLSAAAKFFRLYR